MQTHAAGSAVSSARTTIGACQGVLGMVPAPQLGAPAVQEAIQRAKLPAENIDAVLMVLP